MTTQFVPGATSSVGPVGDQTARVLEILERYMSDLEQGKRISPEEVAAGHPELADILQGYFKKLNTLHEAAVGLAESGRGPAVLHASMLSERGRLGDFHIVREIGRGGMGVVYEAEQISLGRRVALKVLPFATALNAKQLRRFQNEAQAAAHLHHSNIVPVHAVGMDRGIHYYAMQFIEGQTLAKMVQEMRQLAGRVDSPFERLSSEEEPGAPEDVTTQPHHPAPAWQFEGPPPSPEPDTAKVQATAVSKRSQRDPSHFQLIARFGVQAAEALEHAHQMGVVHRDIKPANLLVNDRGHLWITDFGLAYCQGEGGLTLSGDMLGTLRYMSPEQALAKRIRVTHHTDIYSLGVTLYEVLTLEPAYNGRDRQEILKQIAFEDPRRPRKINAAIPFELETIVLKAMAKEPECRYATAQDMADDLRRFLEQRPILARRPTVRERLRKWAIRHKQLVLTCIAVFFVSAVVCSLLLWREKRKTDAANDNLQTINALLVSKTEEAVNNSQRAESALVRAQDNFRRLSEGVLVMLRQVEDTRWTEVPHINDVRQAMAKDLLDIFKDYRNAKDTDPEARLEAGWAYLFTANVDRVQGTEEEAEKGYRKAVDLFASLVRDFPAEPKYRSELGCAYFALGWHLYSINKKHLEAKEAFHQSAESYHSALVSSCAPETLNNYAWLLSICPYIEYQDPSRAIQLVDRAIARNQNIGVFFNTRGVAKYRNGDWQGAIVDLKESMRLRKGGDGFDWFFLAMAYWQKNDKAEARKWYEKGKKNIRNTNTYAEPVWPHYCEAASLLGEKCPGPSAKRPIKTEPHA
jgi:serine/threonine protein kinase